VNLRHCNDDNISFLDFLSNIIFLSSANPLWAGSIVPGGITISVEVIFYLIFPFLFNKIKNLDTAVKFFIFSLFLSFALKFLLNNFLIIDCERLKEIFIYNNIFNQFPVFLLGIISYFLIINKDFKLKSNTIFLIFTLVFIYSTWNVIIIKFHIVSFSALLFLFLLSRTRSKLFLNKIISLIGKVSYSAYLIHFIVIYYLSVFFEKNNIELNFVSVYLLTVLITTIISYISHILIEKPFIRLGKKFT
jgi:peptidoglycan/LPS O-acetylase OafA/YrhL